ncbi:MAG: hypothetical protein HC942_09450 [Microcoleus sp. SU_5_6]|nr:hypothetical protein [Microcoleus sp. SU_5_6]
MSNAHFCKGDRPAAAQFFSSTGWLAAGCIWLPTIPAGALTVRSYSQVRES